MEAIPMNGLYAAMAMSARILSAESKKENEGLVILNALKESLQTVCQVIALISYAQDQEHPLVNDEDGGVQGINPAQVLRYIADSWDNSEEPMHWDEDVEMFVTNFRKVMADLEVENIPENFTVEDILGEGKDGKE